MVLATLYRFGYDLTVLAETKKEAEKAIMKEYSKTYKEWNGTTPGKDYCDDGVTYYAQAKEDINYHDIEIGKVEWR